MRRKMTDRMENKSDRLRERKRDSVFSDRGGETGG